MIEVLAILTVLSGILLVKFYNQLLDKVIEILANGIFIASFSFNLIKGILDV